jgi:hypothetical protein
MLLKHLRSSSIIGLIIWLLSPGWMSVEGFIRQFDPDGNPRRIDFSYTPVVRYHLGTTGSVRGVLTNEWNAVRAAFGQWEAVPGTVIRFEEGPPAPASPSQIPEVDGRIDIFWVNPGMYPIPALGGTITLAAGQIALAAFVEDGTGVVLQAVILVNRTLDYLDEFEGASANRPFLESVILHEIGHILGLNHSPIGAATLWWYQGGGVGAAAGLSSDELCFAQSVYGTSQTRAGLGTVRGVVRRQGTPILGAVVSVETVAGEMIASTITRANGSYELPGLPPNTYRLRVNPLDTGTNSDSFLVRANELDLGVPNAYANAVTDFFPTSRADAVEAVVGSGQIMTRDLTVTAGQSAHRITEMRVGYQSTARQSGDEPLQLIPGRTDAWIGVYIPNLPGDTPATLHVSGPGIVEGTTQVIPQALRSLTLVQMPISIQPDAPAGMRSIWVALPGATVWANGFLDVRAVQPDYNFDGVDDLFQRRHFFPFTRTEAGPEQDPDNDGYVNRREAQFGTDPTDTLDFPFLISGHDFHSGTDLLTWESVLGRRYQVWSRPGTGPDPWETIGLPIQASAEQTTFQLLESGVGAVELFRIEVLP